MKKLVIGLTGGIGSGKSIVADLFEKRGITIIDADVVARDAVKPGSSTLTEIVNQFGHDILNEQNKLDRTKLRETIFQDSEKRKWLEGLLHPLIRDEMQRQIDESSSPYCIAAIPLLIENLPNPLVNRILVVDAPEALQRRRVMDRDNVESKHVDAIIASQCSQAERLKHADDIITNDQDLSALETQVEKLHQLYLRSAGREDE